MYATDSGQGGITPLESTWFPTNEFFDVNITGNCGNIMKESVTVARDLAWSITPIQVQEKYLREWKEFKKGIHIHAYDAATSKEGPSAGTAITTLIYSVLNNLPIRNDIAITGEINLKGEVLPIGGLKSKLYGAKKAGIRLAMYPIGNQPDMDKIKRDNPDLLDETFNAIPINTIHQALENSIKSKSTFTKSKIVQNGNKKRKL